MSWRLEYGILLLLSTGVDYYCSLQIERYRTSKSIQKWFLNLSLCSNLVLLFFFKYLNTVTEDFVWLSSYIDPGITWTPWNVIIPIGISFYTFQTISYTIDVYREKIPAERNFATFALYVSFFPQLVAGPIERANNLLPQFNSDRQVTSTMFISGLKLATFGFFKKMVVADNLAPFVDKVFDVEYTASSIENLLGTYAFTFLIYADFSGYSDIAIGIARMIGFRLMTNFRQPYLATSIIEFWRRWHVSLSFWLRDYVYIPLGGSHKGEIRTYGNLLATMLISGIWHGAAWHFIFWSFLMGMAVIVYKFFKDHPIRLINERLSFFTSNRFMGTVLTFHVFAFGLIYFRALSIEQGNRILASIVSLAVDPFSVSLPIDLPKVGFIFSAILLLIDLMEEKYRVSNVLNKVPFFVRYTLYSALIFSILVFGIYKSSQFVYFQF